MAESSKLNYQTDKSQQEISKFFNSLRKVPAVYSKRDWEEDYQRHVRT